MAKVTKQANQPMTTKMKLRLNRVVAGVMAALVLYVGGNLVNAAVIKADFYQKYAANLQMSSQTITANRGTIYSTNMGILAKSATVWTVQIAPSIIENDKLYVEIGEIPEGTEQELANGLANLFGMEKPDSFLKSFKTGQRFVLVRKKMSKELQAKAQEFIDAGNSCVMFAKEAVAKGLSDILDLDYDTVLEKTYKNNQYEIIKKKVEKPEADEIRTMISQNAFTFITLVEDSKRYYPNNSMASNLLGFTGADNQGVYGVELQYNSILEGTNGKLMTANDGKGNPIPTNYENKYEPVNGQDIVLTIDENIQRFADNEMENIMRQHKPEDGAVIIVMNVNTGAIYALSTSDSYDLNNPSVLAPDYLRDMFSEKVSVDEEGKEHTDLSDEELVEFKSELRNMQWGNKALGQLYEPGSVFKVITAAAALETGTNTMDDGFHCTGSYTIPGTGVTMRCNEHGGHGSLNFKEAIVKSCNPAFIQIGAKLGKTQFSSYFDQFGLTEATGVDLPGEAERSQYVPESKMGPVELASSSYGQTFTITPLQMITAISAAVNGGYLVQPHVLKEVLDENGNVVETNNPEPRRQVISEETSALIREAMEAMVEDNRYVRTPGYRIGGKSGTSQKKNDSVKYGNIASFATFAPADDPQIAVLAIVNKPTEGKFYGSVVSGPSVQTVTVQTLSYLGITAEYSDEELEQMNTAVPNMIGSGVEEARADLRNKGLGVRVVGDGDTVIEQNPRSGRIASESEVILYTSEDHTPDQVAVPDVVGLSPKEANQVLTNARLTVCMSGETGKQGDYKVLLQSISAGETVDEGTTVTITYGRQVSD